MPRVRPFDEHTGRYERWFEKHRWAYDSELQAVRSLVPENGEGVEIGVGTGRFSAPLGIKIGVEPSSAMRVEARSKGIKVVAGVAEALPLQDNSLDFALMVTTICFVDDIEKSFEEVRRVLKPGGCLVIGFVDKGSPLGKEYQQEKARNVFYRIATFYSVDEVTAHLAAVGFHNLSFRQTIFNALASINEMEPVKEGYGEGSFVVVRAIKA